MRICKNNRFRLKNRTNDFPSDFIKNHDHKNWPTKSDMSNESEIAYEQESIFEKRPGNQGSTHRSLQVGAFLTIIPKFSRTDRWCVDPCSERLRRGLVQRSKLNKKCLIQHLKWDVSSRWSLSLYYPMRNSDQMTESRRRTPLQYAYHKLKLSRIFYVKMLSQNRLNKAESFVYTLSNVNN